jgi:hypothetical protein
MILMEIDIFRAYLVPPKNISVRVQVRLKLGLFKSSELVGKRTRGVSHSRI